MYKRRDRAEVEFQENRVKRFCEKLTTLEKDYSTMKKHAQSFNLQYVMLKWKYSHAIK